ncbi:hypothetical protein BOX15_Mlig012197g1 [Macrostomum lignano]|uniref:Ubiquitin carboxyl-terminal hydrolase n=2 Tax=Macrostomum lignano TaxID=282301 RepID=A0A1I8GLH1_9PLAT|nr:hypothetical protein BOX15_Mlig012197g1 [Macrostomum lignano]
MAMQWIPLESNPEVLNKYAHNLGLPSNWNFIDVFSLDSDVLAMVPQPVAGLVFIYPITPESEAEPFGEQLEKSDDVYFMKQTVSNACGTVAMLHTIGNSLEKLKLKEGSSLLNFFNKSSGASCTPETRAKLMAEDETLTSAHEEAAGEGQTETPSRDTCTNLHFVALLHRSGQLWEMDGRRNGPICHGATTEDQFLLDSAKVMQKYIDRQGKDDVHFSVIALAEGESMFS